MIELHPKLVILGPQGAGKGTQAALLARHFHLPHISAGDLLRAEAHRGTKLGKQIARIIDHGKLVPDSLMSQVVRRRLRQPDARRGWILDGYPRFKVQAESFNQFARPTLVIALKLSDEQAIRRLSGRRVCARGHIYHLRHDPPQKHRGFCDHDGLPLRKRDDDTPSAIRQRLRWHHKQTDPLLKNYRQHGMVLEINARPGISTVYKSLLSKLDHYSWLSSPTPKK